jgi:hypothetical protein
MLDEHASRLCSAAQLSNTLSFWQVMLAQKPRFKMLRTHPLASSAAHKMAVPNDQNATHCVSHLYGSSMSCAKVLLFGKISLHLFPKISDVPMVTSL